MTTAYLADPTIKAEIIAHLEAHRAADQIVKGVYWEDGRGCAVGCSLESWRQARGLKQIDHGRHAIYNDIFGPGGEMLASLEDAIFEGLPNGAALDFPLRFAAAIRPGADVSRVGWQFLHWLLTDSTVNPDIDHPWVRDAVRQCAVVLVPLTKGEPSDTAAAMKAAMRAEAAAVRAPPEAIRAAEAAMWAALAAARESKQPRAGARAAGAAADARVEHVLMADKLISLLEAA